MLRWLFRLLIIGLLFSAVVWVLSRLLNDEEDFDDFDDIDAGFEFTETPVEIDVPVEDNSTRQMSDMPAVSVSTEGNGSLVDINGIGPTFASRLTELGVPTIDDLARADADDLADKLNVIGGREEIQDWIEQAKRMSSSEAH